MKLFLALLLSSASLFAQASAAGRIGGTGTQLFPANPQTSTYQTVALDFQLSKVIPVASGTFTITLVASTSQPANGQCIRPLNYGTGIVTIAPSGQNINGSGSSIPLAAGSASTPTGLLVCSDGTNYTAQPLGAASLGNTGASVTSVTPVTATASVTTDQQLMELALSAGYLNSAKQPFLFNGAGVYTTPVGQTPTLTFKAKICTVSGCGSGTVVTLVSIVTTATLASSTNNNWNLSFIGYTATTGTTGNLEIHGPLSVDLGALTTTADSIFNDVNTAVSGNIDLTAALFVDFTVTTSTASASNAITQRQGGVMPFAATAAPVTSVNGLTGAVTGITQTICSGTVSLGTTLMTPGTKFGTSASVPLTATCTGMATSDTVSWTFASDPSGVTGYGPSASGSLSVGGFQDGANTIGFWQYNNTASSITPGAMTLNYRVTR